MKRMISLKTAALIQLTLLTLLFIFHILLILRILPKEWVWGGLASDAPGESFIIMEVIALVILLIFILITLFRSGFLKQETLKMAVYLGTWIMFAYFILNAVANFSSEAKPEQWIFGPLTILLALLSLRLATE